MPAAALVLTLDVCARRFSRPTGDFVASCKDFSPGSGILAAWRR
jgi:hypothetical protein